MLNVKVNSIRFKDATVTFALIRYLTNNIAKMCFRTSSSNLAVIDLEQKLFNQINVDNINYMFSVGDILISVSQTIFSYHKFEKKNVFIYLKTNSMLPSLT